MWLKNMNQEQPIITTIEKPPIQSAGFDYRYSTSPSICDSGIYSNSEIPSSTDEKLTNIEEKLEHIGDSSQKLILARQIIKKLKNELQCVSKSEKWYKNELKVQKKSRIDTLEKLYVNEKYFFKTNQNLELECQKLHLSYNQLKNKSKKDRELWLKQFKKDRKIANQVLEENINDEATNYTIQKLKKIVEEHETLIDVFRKQKHNLLTDLHNLTSEKDGKIMLLERKCAILEKENCMLVEKCKAFIIANQKLRETKDKSTSNIGSSNKNEIEKLQTVLIAQNLEIDNLKSRLLKLDEYKIENEKQKIDLNQFKLNLDTKNCEIEQIRKQLNKKELELFEIDKNVNIKIEKIEELQRNLLKSNEENHILCSDFSMLMYKILRIGEILKDNDLDFDSNNFNFCHLKLLLLKIKSEESEFKPDFQKLKLCHEVLETLIIKLNNAITSINMHNKSQELLSIVNEFEDIFDEQTILMQISSDENHDDKSIIKNLTFSIEKSIKKNELLYDIFLQNFDKILCNKNNFSKFQEIFKQYNNFVLNQNDTTFESSNNFLTQYQSGYSNFKLNNDFNQSDINMLHDLNELKASLVLQQEEYQKKISRHQVHVRSLMSNIKSSKKKFEGLNNKYLIILQKCENLDKVIKEKLEIENILKTENKNLHTTVINVKIENQNYLKIINNLQYQIKTIVKQLNEGDTQRRINSDLKNNLTNLINDYKEIIKNNQIICESVKSNINYGNIYDLIYKSNNCVPNIRNLCQSVSDIKNDVKTILQNYTNAQDKDSNLVKDQRKSLMDELKEASTVSI